MLIDTCRLNRIIEINRADRYVIAECGVTWAQLFEALEPLGLRTPYFGPLSGLEATLGGALSQGSVFLGSGIHGSVGDSVLGLDVATTSGDAGTLGIKLRASLRLLEAPTHLDYRSWQFRDSKAMFAAMAELARAGLASEYFGFGPLLAEMRMKRSSLSEDAGTMAQVVKRQGLMSGMKLAAHGRCPAHERCGALSAGQVLLLPQGAQSRRAGAVRCGQAAAASAGLVQSGQPDRLTFLGVRGQGASAIFAYPVARPAPETKESPMLPSL